MEAEVQGSRKPRFAATSGALNATNLGAYSLADLAELVNWSNSSDYVRQELKPWVALESELADTTPASNNVAEQIDPTEDIPASESPQINNEANRQVIPDQANESAAADALDITDPAPAEIAEQTQVEPDPADSQSVAIEDNAETNNGLPGEVPRAGASSETEVEQPSATVAIEADCEAASDIQQTLEDADNAGSTDASTEETKEGARQGSVVQEATVAADREQDVRGAEQSSAENAARDDLGASERIAQHGEVEREPAELEGVQSTAPVTSTRSQIASQSRAARPSIPSKPRMLTKKMRTTNQPSAPASDTDYLRRLESLVLELNLQLARQSGDESQQIGEDYTQWLSQRVIDLSLENMALHERVAELQNAQESSV